MPYHYHNRRSSVRCAAVPRRPGAVRARLRPQAATVAGTGPAGAQAHCAARSGASSFRTTEYHSPKYSDEDGIRPIYLLLHTYIHT